MWTSEEVQLERKKAYAEGRADAIKEFPTHLPAIDEESRKKLNSTINEAAEFIRTEAFEKGKIEGAQEGYQKGWEAGYAGAERNAISALEYSNGDGYGPAIKAAIQARDARFAEKAIKEVNEAWSWWTGATVEGRKQAGLTGRDVRSNVAYYLARATNWAINYNTGELDNPIARATVLQEGRKVGHEAAIEFAKQVIAGTSRDTSYGIKEAVDARVRSAEMKASDEGYTRGRAEAFTFAGAAAQAALKSGHFASTPDAHELNKALDGFLERERSPGDISRRIWDSATTLTKAYIAGDTVGIGGSGQAHLFTLLRQLRKDSYIDGFEKARILASNAAGGVPVPERHEIPDPVSDIPF